MLYGAALHCNLIMLAIIMRCAFVCRLQKTYYSRHIFSRKMCGMISCTVCVCVWVSVRGVHTCNMRAACKSVQVKNQLSGIQFGVSLFLRAHSFSSFFSCFSFCHFHGSRCRFLHSNFLIVKVFSPYSRPAHTHNRICSARNTEHELSVNTLLLLDALRKECWQFTELEALWINKNKNKLRSYTETKIIIINDKMCYVLWHRQNFAHVWRQQKKNKQKYYIE